MWAGNLHEAVFSDLTYQNDPNLKFAKLVAVLQKIETPKSDENKACQIRIIPY